MKATRHCIELIKTRYIGLIASFYCLSKLVANGQNINFTTNHAYLADGMMDGMLEKQEFITSFNLIHMASSIISQLTVARENSSLWENLQKASNTVYSHITVLIGHQCAL